MHPALLLAPALIFFCAIGFVIPVLFRLLRPCSVSDLTPEWVDEFETSSYSPMQGLLKPDDFEFISRQPGFDPSIRRKLRQDRLRIFRQYLDRLIQDFNRLHRAALIIVSRSGEDRSDLLVRLMKLRVEFSVSIIRVEFSYLLCRLGMQSMGLGDLLSRVDAMSSQLAALPRANFSAASL